MQLKDSPPKKREPSVTNSDYHPLCEWCVPESETTVDVNSFKTSLKDLLAERTLALCHSHQPDRFQLCKVASRKLRSCTRKEVALGLPEPLSWLLVYTIPAVNWGQFANQCRRFEHRFLPMGIENRRSNICSL